MSKEQEEKGRGKGGRSRELHHRRVSPARRATDKEGKNSRCAEERDRRKRDSPRYEEAAEAEVEAEAEAAAVVAAVPGHQGTVTRAQALLDRSWCGLHNEEGRREGKR